MQTILRDSTAGHIRRHHSLQPQAFTSFSRRAPRGSRESCAFIFKNPPRYVNILYSCICSYIILHFPFQGVDPSWVWLAPAARRARAAKLLAQASFRVFGVWVQDGSSRSLELTLATRAEVDPFKVSETILDARKALNSNTV